MNSTKIQKIINDCFWDINITETEIESIINGNDFRKKAFLFDKILLNSTNLFASMSLFDENDLENLINSYQVPKFNSDYSKKRLNILEVLFLDKPVTINELKWIKI